MAKQIRGKEIIEDNHLANAIASATQLKNVYKELDDQILKTAKDAKANVSALAPNDAKSIIKINAELEKSIKLLEAKNDLEEKQKKVKTTLNDLSDKELKKRVQNQTELAKRKKLLKEELILENEQVGTLQKLAVANSKLRKERELLNLETKKGQDRLKQINSELDKNNAKINSFSDNLKKRKINIGNYGSALNGATASLKRFAGALGLTGGIYLLAQGVRNAFNVIKDFEQANANLASILGKTSDGVSELTNNAKELGSQTVFTASQITELQTELAKLGFNEKEILASTEAIQGLAAATGTDLAQSALQVGSTLRGFGLEAEEASRVVDVLALSTTKSALDMSKLATALPIVGSTAKTAGLSLERTTALLGVLSDRGLDASTSGTALRNIFLELSKQGLTYSEAMDKINNATDKNKVAMELFGKRGATASIILAENAASANSLEEALLNSGGAAKKMADTQLDTLNGALALLKSAWEGLMLDFADSNGIFSGLKETIKFIAENLGTIVSVVINLTKAFVAYKVGVIATNLALKAYALYQKLATDGLKAFNQQMKLNPFGLILATLVVLLPKMIDFGRELFGLEKKTNALNEANKRINSTLVQEKAKMESLFQQLEKTNAGTEERKNLIDEINDKYGTTLQNLDDETAFAKQLATAYEDVNKQLEKKISIKIYEQTLEELIRKELEIKKLAEEFATGKTFTGDFKGLRNFLSADEIASLIKENYSEITKQKEEIFDAINALDEIEVTNEKILDTEKEITNERVKQGKINTDTVKQKEKEYEYIKKIKLVQDEEGVDMGIQKEKDKISQEIIFDEDFHNKLNEDFTKIQESIKSLGETTTEVLTQLANVIENRLNDAIEKQNNLIAESQDRVNQLQDQAKMGNLDAQESIKAEKAQIAKDKLELERLEKKKRNLQILVTGLNLANNYIQQGDNEGLTKATMQMGEFVNGLAGFYDGTDTTLGDSLGVAYSYKLNNDKDTHIIKAHKDEMIIGVDNMKQMPNGITQDEVVRRVGMFEDGYFKNKTALVYQSQKQDYSYLLSQKLDMVEKAIKNIDIPEHQFRYDELNRMAIETIKMKNKVITNRKNLGGTFS